MKRTLSDCLQILTVGILTHKQQKCVCDIFVSKYFYNKGDFFFNPISFVRRLYALAPIVTHQHLSLFLLNACSVKNKTADLFDYICDCKADLVATTETWLTIDDDAVQAKLCPVGYKISDCPRTGRRVGGVGLIYRESLSVRWIDVGGKESFEYSEWIISSPSLNLRLVLLYRPPYTADHRV